MITYHEMMQEHVRLNTEGHRVNQEYLAAYYKGHTKKAATLLGQLNQLVEQEKAAWQFLHTLNA